MVLVLKASEKNQPELIGYSTAEIIAHAVPTEPKSFGRQPSAEPSHRFAFGKLIRYFLAVLLGEVFRHLGQLFADFWSLFTITPTPSPSRVEARPPPAASSTAITPDSGVTFAATLPVLILTRGKEKSLDGGGVRR